MLGTAGSQHHRSQCHPVVVLYLQGFLGGWEAEQQHGETEALGGGWLLPCTQCMRIGLEAAGAGLRALGAGLGDYPSAGEGLGPWVPLFP